MITSATRLHAAGNFLALAGDFRALSRVLYVLNYPWAERETTRSLRALNTIRERHEYGVQTEFNNVRS